MNLIKLSYRLISSYTGLNIYLFLFLAFSAETMSQSSYILNPVSSEMTILGTSSLHDWQMEVKDINCYATMISDGKNVRGIKDAWFNCLTTSIVSDNKLMDKKTYEALKADEFSNIDFKMTDGRVFSISANEFSGIATGYLSIAGQKREINIPFSGNLWMDGQVKLEGKVVLKMSEFNIKPPTALLGSLKTGDEVSIVYSLLFENIDLKKSIAGSGVINNIGN
jgi:hypothetical protein